MSGPKRSRWNTNRQVFEQLRQQRTQERQRQITEIHAGLRAVQHKLKTIKEDIGESANYLDKWVKIWSLQAESDCAGDLRNAWNGLHGIESYLDKQHADLQKRRAKRQARLAEEQHKAELKKQEEERIQALIRHRLQYFDDICAAYPQLVNQGVQQRIDLFRQALSANPDNKDTLAKIQDFKLKFEEIVSKHELDKAQRDYLMKTLAEIIRPGDEASGADSEGLTGSFEGTPIKIVLDPQDNQITFDLPDDGSCKPNIAKLLSKIEAAGIKLGHLQVLKTGEVLHYDRSEHNEQHTTRA
ncbi:MAG: hypothetical protein PHY24_00725 [Candidatus Cloacimonetes bacterium]|jgi:hypothetical protein|nr:hypothetical protein [Candidatus Cloacimonadota bacterium]MCB5255511.1 hypothetical protein [Candidatus Cloacimonadota bacterium]MCK9179052.1 hypothetical protein [Candidatus Cloacimonadota bacterium]MCK9242082.1 hypothetical protein [Candidatus Cloacimonadota bacterium]MDD3102719.1 hypothetical protein [Candidatus Cloacimonadota bacterium]